MDVYQNPKWRTDEEGMNTTNQNVKLFPDQSYSVYGGGIDVRVVLGTHPVFAARFAEIIVMQNFQPHRDVRGRAVDLFNVFRPPGGIVVCQVLDGWPGQSRYSPALQIPEGWEKWVESAVKYVRENPGILKPGEKPTPDELHG